MQTEELPDSLERLDTLLLAIDDEEAMLLGELDGYLVGVLVSPEPIAEDEWLPAIFAEVLPEALAAAGSIDEFNTLIRARHAEIAGELAEDHYQPLYEVDETDQSMIWELWTQGFERAMGLRIPAWQKLLQSQQESIAQESIFTILDMLDLAHADPKPEDKGAVELIAEAHDLIPELAGNLYRAHVVAATREPVRNAVTVGRNDPCPCGSGLKYKKCHGATAA